MRLARYAHVTVADCVDAAEQAALCSILHFRDPTAESDWDFKQGTWDGMRTFFLDKEMRTFPSGLFSHVLLELAKAGITPVVEDHLPLPVLPQGAPHTALLDGVTLRDYQVDAISEILRRKRGVVSIAPRGGKTEIQIAVAKLLNVPSILLVEKKDLLEQHYERFVSRGVGPIGRLGGGHRELGALHVVATFQTLWRAIQAGDTELGTWLQGLQLAQCDECHHLGSANTYYQVFAKIPAAYRIGYSGTPLRVAKGAGFHHADFALMGATGPRIVEISSKYLRDARYLVEPVVLMPTIKKPSLWHMHRWPNVHKKGIVENDYRNKIIAQIVRALHDAGETVLVLVKEIKHGFSLLKSISEDVDCAMVFGNQRSAVCKRGSLQHDTQAAQVKQMLLSGRLRCVVGSTVYDEGIDLPSLSAVVIGDGGKSTIRTLQRAFRAMTVSEGKTQSYVVDFIDHTSPMLRAQSNKRKADYEAEGIEVVTSLPIPLRKAFGLA